MRSRPLFHWRLVAAAAALTAVVSPVGGRAAQAQTAVTPAYSATATGAVVHLDAVSAVPDGPRLADAEVAFSGATAGSTGLANPVVNEMDQVVQTARADKHSYGQGSGLQVGAGTSLPSDPGANPLILAGLAEADAAPTTPIVTEEVGPVPAAPLAYASLLRGQAAAAWSDRGCVLGQPLGFGRGYAEDVQLLDTGAEPGPDGQLASPLASVDTTADNGVESRSFSYLVPNGDGTFGLVSEVRQHIAPVTLFKGTENQITIEALGEFILRAVATGKPGGAKVMYAPDGGATPTTPILSITLPGQEPMTLSFQDIFGEDGLDLPDNPLFDIAVAEKPRGIGDTADASEPSVSADGTSAAAAVDVARVMLLPGLEASGLSTLDLRIGHMETSVTVPAGGIRCSIPVTKTATPDPVQAGQTFTWTITFPDPAADFPTDCDLVDISVDDRTRVTEGSVRYEIVEASGGGVVDGNDHVTWSGLGPWHPGDPPIVLTITGRILPTSGAGRLENTANVTASLANCRGGAAGDALVGEGVIEGSAVTGNAVFDGAAVTGGATVGGPGVGRGAGALAGAEALPRTGSELGPVALLLVAAASGAALRRRGRLR